MSSEQTDLEILREAVPGLEAEGYEVYLQPNPPIRPRFLSDFVPDAIALRSDGNLVIEMVRPSRHEDKKIKAISELVKRQPGWTLRIMRVSSSSRLDDLTAESRDTILDSVGEARELVATGHFEAALLLCWATLEATARLKVPDFYRKPQTPGRIIETLAAAGELTPTQAEDMRKLAEKRNKLVHGQLGVRVEKAEVERFCDIVAVLLEEPQAAE